MYNVWHVFFLMFSSLLLGHQYMYHAIWSQGRKHSSANTKPLSPLSITTSRTNVTRIISVVIFRSFGLYINQGRINDDRGRCIIQVRTNVTFKTTWTLRACRENQIVRICASEKKTSAVVTTHPPSKITHTCYASFSIYMTFVYYVYILLLI